MIPAIEITDLSKAYRIGLKKRMPDTLMGAIKKSIFSPLTNLRELRELDTGKLAMDSEIEGVLWALRNVSFTIAEGDVVGIVGRNGSGKSTLLKIISRITEPTRGRVVIRGRVSSLLEVGTGFHPDLSGRDNVYMNGTVLGMRKAEIDAKFDEIVEFSGVSQFLDTPMKRYSSGMKVRLAFAVAAHLEPEVLVVDEVLAVGDVAFQKKCLGKMQEIAGGGRTVLFVSHNMQAVHSLCNKAVFLSHGRVEFEGRVGDVVQRYLEANNAAVQDEWKGDVADEDSAMHVSRIRAELLDEQPHHTLRIAIDLRSIAVHEPAFVAINFYDQAGNRLMQAMPTLVPFIAHASSSQQVTVDVKLPPMIPGEYSLGVWLGSSLGRPIVEVHDAVGFSIVNSPTVNRSSVHDLSHGYIVPESTVWLNRKAVASLPAVRTG